MLSEKDKASGIYNIASGIKRPLKEFVIEMKEIINSNSKLEFGAVSYGPEGPIDLLPDNSKLCSLGWKPEIEFKEGITKLLTK